MAVSVKRDATAPGYTTVDINNQSSPAFEYTHLLIIVG